MELKPKVKFVFSRGFKVTLVLVLLALAVFGLVYRASHRVKFFGDALNNSSAVTWTKCLVKKDYTKCDSFIENTDDCIVAYDLEARIHDTTYYFKIMDALADSIQSIEFKSVSESDGFLTYEVEVTYLPFDRVNVLQLPQKEIEDLKKGYIAGSIKSSDVESELLAIYKKSFNTNVLKRSDGVDAKKKVLTLSEKEVNGVTYVYNTVSFVDILLSESNLLNNLQIYESCIKEEVNNLLKAN